MHRHKILEDELFRRFIPHNLWFKVGLPTALEPRTQGMQEVLSQLEVTFGLL